MTSVSFHFNVPDRIAYACRLLRKAQGSAAKVVVTGPSAWLDELDRSLWTFSPLDFVAHCRGTASPSMQELSAVLLLEDVHASPHHEVLLHLGGAAPVPAGFEQYGRVIEIVGMDELERAAARQRWRHYQQQGYDIVRHDLALQQA